MIYTKEFLKIHGIKNISMITETTCSPKFYVEDLTGHITSYLISRTEIEDMRDGKGDYVWNKILNDYLKKLRKEKLDKLNICNE